MEEISPWRSSSFPSASRTGRRSSRRSTELADGRVFVLSFRRFITTLELSALAPQVLPPVGEAVLEVGAEVGEGGEVGGFLGAQREVDQRLVVGEELGELHQAPAVALPEPGQELDPVHETRHRRRPWRRLRRPRRPGRPEAQGLFRLGMDAVDDDRAQVVAGLLQAAGEEEGIRDALLAGAGDEDEEGLRRAQELLDLVGALAEAGEEGREGLEELGHVAQQVEADHLVEEALGAAAQAPQPGGGLEAPLLVEPGAEGDAQRATVQETDDPRRRLQEIQGLAGRRGVEHDLPVAAGRGHLEQALDRHVLEDAAQAPREVLVEAVAQHAAARLRVGGIAFYQAVEGAAGVEQAGVQLAHGLEVDADGVLLRLLADTQGILQPQRRVEGHHQGVAPGARRGHAQGGRERRLADAAGADEDDQRMLVREQAHPRSATRPAASSCRKASVRAGPRSRASSGSSIRGPSHQRASRSSSRSLRKRRCRQKVSSPVASGISGDGGGGSGGSSGSTGSKISGRSRPAGSGGKRPLTISSSGWRPSWLASASRSSSASSTGISSAWVTTTMPQRSGSATKPASSPARAPKGPVPITSETSRGAASRRTPWPVAGASRTTRSSCGASGGPTRRSRRRACPRMASSSRPGAPAENCL